MEGNNNIRQKGFLIRDLLESSTSSPQTTSTSLVSTRHLEPVVHTTPSVHKPHLDYLQERAKSISNLNKLLAISHQKSLAGPVQKPIGDSKVDSIRRRVDISGDDDSDSSLDIQTVKDDPVSPNANVRDTMPVPIKRPIPGIPRLLLGSSPLGSSSLVSSPLRMPHIGLPDVYRDPRLFRLPGPQGVTQRCPCTSPDCQGNWNHGCRVFKGLYSGDQLFEFKDTLPVPVPLPFYVRMRADSLACDGCFKTKKCRRSRTVFTELQLMGLEKRFETQKYLSTPDRLDLAEKLGLTQIQVKTWYQNRRMKWKKQVLQSGGTEAPTKPKGRPRKVQSSPECDPEVIV